MNIKHVVLLNWKAGVSPDQVDAVTESLGKIKSEIDVVKSYQYGADAGLIKGNADYGIVAEFESEADLKAYVVHPLHQRLLTEVAGPILDSFQSAQFTVES